MHKLSEEMNNIEKIKNIINDIEYEFETQKNEIEKAIASLKDLIKNERFDFENKKLKSNKKYANLKELYNKLLDEKNYNLTLINNDQNDLLAIENENFDLRGQIEKQEINNAELRRSLEHKKVSAIDSKKKLDLLYKSNQTKESKLISKVSECKKYLGLDFNVVEGNKIKVLFNKFCKDETFECYVVLDLSDGYNIIDIYPKVINIERYSTNLKDKTRFFELIQDVRKIFVKEYCK